MANREFYKVLALILFTWAFVMSIKAQGIPITFDSHSDEDLFFTVLAGEAVASDVFSLATETEEIYVLASYLEDTLDGTPYKYYSIMTHIVARGKMIPVVNIIGFFTIGEEQSNGEQLSTQFIEGLSEAVFRIVEQIFEDKQTTKKQS